MGRGVPVSPSHWRKGLLENVLILGCQDMYFGALSSRFQCLLWHCITSRLQAGLFKEFCRTAQYSMCVRDKVPQKLKHFCFSSVKIFMQIMLMLWFQIIATTTAVFYRPMTNQQHQSTEEKFYKAANIINREKTDCAILLISTICHALATHHTPDANTNNTQPFAQ